MRAIGVAVLCIACAPASPTATAPVPSRSATPVARNAPPTLDHPWTKEDYAKLVLAFPDIPRPRFGDPLFEYMTTSAHLRLLDGSLPAPHRAEEAASIVVQMRLLLELYHLPEFVDETHMLAGFMLRLLSLELECIRVIARGNAKQGREWAEGMLALLATSETLEKNVDDLIRILRPTENRRRTLPRFISEIAPAFPDFLDDVSPRRREELERAVKEYTASAPDLAPLYQRLLGAIRPPASVTITSKGIAGNATRGAPVLVDVSDDVPFASLYAGVTRLCAEGATIAVLRSDLIRWPVSCTTGRKAVRMSLRSPGIVVSTAQGNVAPKCKAEGPGVAVPGTRANVYDAEALGYCIAALRGRLEERTVTLSAPARAPFSDVVMIGVIGRGPFQSAFAEWTLAPPEP